MLSIDSVVSPSVNCSALLKATRMQAEKHRCALPKTDIQTTCEISWEGSHGEVAVLVSLCRCNEPKVLHGLLQRF